MSNFNPAPDTSASRRAAEWPTISALPTAGTAEWVPALRWQHDHLAVIETPHGDPDVIHTMATDIWLAALEGKLPASLLDGSEHQWIRWQPNDKCPVELFAATDSSISALEQTLSDGSISEDRARSILVDNNDGALTDFGVNALNIYNALYYNCSNAFDEELGPSVFLTDNVLFNRALVDLLLDPNAHGRNWAPQDMLKIKELSCGARAKDRWGHLVDEAKTRGVAAEVVLTDFSTTGFPSLAALEADSGLRFRYEDLNLLDEVGLIPIEQQSHALVATYALDSIWADGDVVYEKVGERWFRIDFRLKVADWHPKRNELLEADLLKASPLTDVCEMDGILIEQRATEVEIGSEPYGTLIKQRAGSCDRRAFTFPGGRIARIEQLMKHQVINGGFLVIADAFRYYTDDPREEGRYYTSGSFAKYNLLDQFFTEQILESKGYHISTCNTFELVRSRLGAKSEYGDVVRDLSAPLLDDLLATGVMFVSSS